MQTMSILTAFVICLTISNPGPSFLLSIPYFTTSNVYPEIKRYARSPIIIPIIPNPLLASILWPE